MPHSTGDPDPPDTSEDAPRANFSQEDMEVPSRVGGVVKTTPPATPPDTDELFNPPFIISSHTC